LLSFSRERNPAGIKKKASKLNRQRVSRLEGKPSSTLIFARPGVADGGFAGQTSVSSAEASENLRFVLGCGNDPSAGSPTETLLRLHLPLDDEV
jgi:hypothetical protein